MVGLLALGVWTLGVPATLLLVGGWALAGGISALAPKLAGTASWAAALLIEVALLSATSATSGLLHIHLNGRWANIIILLMPVIIGVGLYLRSLKERSLFGPKDLTSYQVVGALLAALVLGMFRWLASLGTDYGVAWAMSGDARNEVLVIRSIIRAGGVTLRELKAFPAAMEGIMAQVALAGGRSNLAAGQLMLHDASALAAFYVVACLCMALMTVAALAEFLGEGQGASPRGLRLGSGIVVLGAGMFGITPLVIGTSLDEGFVVAYTAIPILMACTVLALRYFYTPSAGPLAIVGISTIVLLFVWSVVAIVPAMLELAMLVYALRKASRPEARGLVWHAACAIGVLCLITLAAVGVSQEGRLQSAMSGTGAIIPPRVALGVVVEMVAVTFWLGTSGRVNRWRFGSVAIAGGAVASIIWGIHSLGVPPDGVYYSMKTLWVAASSFLWLCFLPLVYFASTGAQAPSLHRRGSVPAALLEVAKASSLLAVVYGVVAMSTTADNLLTMGRTGWFQPSAPVVAEVASAADHYREFVLWDWAANSADDRLGNFWADVAWGTSMTGPGVPYLSPKVYPPGLPGGLYLWAYSQDNDQPSSSAGLAPLCTVVHSVPGIVIVTRLTNLPVLVRRACGPSEARVVINNGAE